MHSYSLVKWDYQYKNFEADFEDIEKLKFILEYAVQTGYKIVSVKMIADELKNFVSNKSLLPRIKTERNIISSARITTYKYFKRKLRGK